MKTPESAASIPPLKLFTFGMVSIQRGDQPVSGFISRKVEALLIYLAFERRKHHREDLAALLWDDLPPPRALANLRTALSNLQSQLADYLLVTRQTVMINPDTPCWLDALELSDALKAARGELTTQVTRQLESALDLYKGDFLSGFHLRDGLNFEGWMLLEAERLRGQVIDALKRLSRDALERGNYSAGIAHAQRVLALDPLLEEAHQTLMLLLARSGQRAAALAQYAACVRLLREELDVAPEPETTRLYTQIQTEQMTSAPAAQKPPVRLPVPATPFVERPAELDQIRTRLNDPDCRLLTIVGPGGIGKTRLALQAAAERSNDYRDGVFFVSLVSVESGDFLPVEIANVLNFTFQGIRQPREELIGYLANREVLLVLDNFDHLVGYADLLSDILKRAPYVHFLVTSRERLNIDAEWALPIDGMAYPPTTASDATGYSAIQLFVACAQRVRPRFSLEQEWESVVKICQLVEGMPLSIELAATWLRIISAAEIVREMNVKFLSTAARDVPERHRSVEAVFDYSWKLLPPDEAHALMKLSVFKGPFDRDAAGQVAGASVLILNSLVEKSLIRLRDVNYYNMHELLRQYAFNRLSEAGEDITTQDAHLKYYVALTSDPDSRIHGQAQTKWLDRLEREHDNLRTALGWALQQKSPQESQATLDTGVELGAAIWEFWLMRSHITEGRQWMDRLLAASTGTISLARGALTQGAGYLAWIQGEHDRAEALHREGLAIRSAIGDKAGMGGSLSNLGVIAWSRGDFAAAREFYEQALAARREANYKLGMGSVLTNLSLLMQDQGEYADAIAYAEEARAIFKELDDLQGMVHVLFNLGAMTHDRGDWDGARVLQEEALVLARQLGDQRVIGALLQNLAHTLLGLGDHELAHAYLDESLQLVTQVGDRQHIALVKRNMASLALRENRIADAQALIQESLAIFDSLKTEVYYGQALFTQGDIQRVCGETSAAQDTYREALAVLLKTRNPQPAAEALYRLAGVAFELGDPVRAATLLSAADALARRLDLRFPDKPERLDRETLRASLSPAEFDEAVQRGAAMDSAALAEYVGLPGSL